MRAPMTGLCSAALLLVIVAGCGPDPIDDADGPPPDDVEWIIDHFARGAD